MRFIIGGIRFLFDALAPQPQPRSDRPIIRRGTCGVDPKYRVGDDLDQYNGS